MCEHNFGHKFVIAFVFNSESNRILKYQTAANHLPRSTKLLTSISQCKSVISQCVSWMPQWKTALSLMDDQVQKWAKSDINVPVTLSLVCHVEFFILKLLQVCLLQNIQMLLYSPSLNTQITVSFCQVIKLSMKYKFPLHHSLYHIVSCFTVM